MSTRYNNGSHYENHQRAAELHEAAAHAHRSAEQQHGKQDHLTGHEQSRHALEHSDTAYQHSHTTTNGHGVTEFNHAEIKAVAHRLWQERGGVDGTPEKDWHDAVRELTSGQRRNPVT